MDDAGPDSVRLLDDQTYETLDRFQLDASELACSVASASFADDPALYYVVGTALAHPDESEPSKARAPLVCGTLAAVTAVQLVGQE